MTLPPTTARTPGVPRQWKPAPSRNTVTNDATSERARAVYWKRSRATTGAHASVAMAPITATTRATRISRTAATVLAAGTVTITANTAVSTVVTTAAPLRRA